MCIRGVQIWGVHNVLYSGFSEKDKENDFSEIVKRVSKIHNLLILAPKMVKQIL
jgi:hypothetical protein